MNEFLTNIVCLIRPYLREDVDIEVVKAILVNATAKYEIAEKETLPAIRDEDHTDYLIKKFIASKMAIGCTKRTIEFYYKEAVLFFKFFSTKTPEQITSDDIRYYLAKQVLNGNTKVTANNKRRALSSFYSWLRREEIISKNPMEKIDPIKTEKKQKKAFTEIEIEKMRCACRTKKETAQVEVLISTWARLSEVVNIKISDIHDNKITVLGKGQKERTVFLNAKAQIAIANYLKEREDNNPYLFPGKIGKTGSSLIWYQHKENVSPDRHIDQGSLGAQIRKLGKRAGVPDAHPHRFRRTGATLALRHGMPLTTVSKILGHESIATTQIYLDITNADMEFNFQKFSNI